MSNIDELVTQLQDPSPDVRSGAVKALSKNRRFESRCTADNSTAGRV